jgi:hypothetical protein
MEKSTILTMFTGQLFMIGEMVDQSMVIAKLGIWPDGHVFVTWDWGRYVLKHTIIYNSFAGHFRSRTTSPGHG